MKVYVYAFRGEGVGGFNWFFDKKSRNQATEIAYEGDVACFTCTVTSEEAATREIDANLDYYLDEAKAVVGDKFVFTDEPEKEFDARQ